MNSRTIWFLVVFIVSLWSNISITAQTNGYAPVIVNEIGYGQNGTSKYVELLVVGPISNQGLTPINLEGWIIDNDTKFVNGDSTFLVLGATFSSVFPGTVILIYDDGKSNPNISQADDGLPNTSGIYQIPISSSSLSKCIKGTSFECTTPSSASSWDAIIPIDKSGDVVQIRDPQGNLSFAVNWSGASFSDDTAPQSMSITGNVGNPEMPVILKEWCDHYELTYERSATATPGHYNSLNNGNFINGLASGTSSSALYLQTEEQIFIAPEEDFGNIDIEVGGGVAPYTVNWSGPSSGSTQYSNAGNYQLANLLPGSYTITIIDAKNCSKSRTVFIRIQDDFTVCEGECIEIGEQTFECFKWEPTEGLINPTQSVTDACPQESTTYTLTITGSDGNIIDEYQYDVEVIQLEVEINPDPAILCDLGTLELTATPGYSTYSWSNLAGTFSGSGEVVEISETGYYNVTVTDVQGCTGFDNVNVLSPDDCEAISEWFVQNGFNSVFVSTYEELGLQGNPQNDNNRSSCPVNDFAFLNVTINGTDYDLFSSMCQMITMDEIETNVYITSNTEVNMCIGSNTTSTFRQVQNIWEETTDQVIVWVHACLNDDGTATLYWNHKLEIADVPFDDPCEEQLLNTIQNEWIRKAFANGKGRPNNNITICNWYNAIKSGNDSGFKNSAIGKIGEGLIAEELNGGFSILDGTLISMVPGGWDLMHTNNDHIDIAAYFLLTRPPWVLNPFGDLPYGISIPSNNKYSGIRESNEFRLVPNSPIAQIAWFEAIIEVKAFSSNNQTKANIDDAVRQVSEGIASSVLPAIGLVVIPKERWEQAPSVDRPAIEAKICELEDWRISLPYPMYTEEQQQGYFYLSSKLYSRALGAYIKIKEDLSRINCQCQ